MTKVLASLALLLSPCQVAPTGDAKPPVAASAPARPAASRNLVVISDLHFGLGKTSATTWDHYEDFRWSSELQQFLSRVDQEGSGRTDLVLNGDTFELWQSRGTDCTSPDADLGCSEAEALARTRRVLQAHQADLSALGRFALSGDNRVVLVPGNHDGALLFSSIAAAVEAAIAAPGRARVSGDGFWLSADGRVYVDHGHQLGSDPNRFSSWPQPFLTRSGVRYLQRTWGENFVTQFYNRFEDRYPTVDNIAPESAAVGFAVAREGASGLFQATQRFLKFNLLQTSWKQKAGVLGQKKGAPTWDIAKIRAAGGRSFLLSSLDAQDPLRALISEGLAAGSDPLADFSDEEISGICDGRLAEVRAGSVPSGQPSQLCPTKDSSLGMGDGAGGGSGTLGIGAGGLLRSRNAIFGRYLTEVSGRAASAAALDATKAAPAIEVYVYSHTHQLEQPWSLPTKYRTLAVINTGAFQRVVAAPVLEAQALRNGIDKKEILTKIHLEDFPACFGFVRVAPYTPQDGPKPLAGFFRVNASGPHETPTCD